MSFEKRELISWLKTGGFLAFMAVVVWWFWYTGSDERREVTPEAQAGTVSGVLKQVGVIDLPGPVGKRFDYLTIDYQRHYLLSTHLAAGLLYIIDLRTNRLVNAIPDVPGIEGVEIVPDRNQAYTSDWWENKIGIIDLDKLDIVKKRPTESKPDGLAYAAPFHKIYVSDERARAEAVVDTKQEAVVRTLHFDSETGNVRYDPVARKILVNLQDENVVAVIDPANDKEIARYPVGECRGNHGMALDAEHRRAFLSCEDNNLMTVFDLENHKPIAHMPMAPGADVIAFDPGLRRIYVACYSGAISIFQEDDPNHFRKLEDFPVRRKVHSLTVDTETHRLYAPEEQENGRPVTRIAIYEPAQH